MERRESGRIKKARLKSEVDIQIRKKRGGGVVSETTLHQVVETVATVPGPRTRGRAQLQVQVQSPGEQDEPGGRSPLLAGAERAREGQQGIPEPRTPTPQRLRAAAETSFTPGEAQTGNALPLSKELGEITIALAEAATEAVSGALREFRSEALVPPGPLPAVCTGTRDKTDKEVAKAAAASAASEGQLPSNLDIVGSPYSSEGLPEGSPLSLRKAHMDTAETPSPRRLQPASSLPSGTVPATPARPQVQAARETRAGLRSRGAAAECQETSEGGKAGDTSEPAQESAGEGGGTAGGEGAEEGAGKRMIVMVEDEGGQRVRYSIDTHQRLGALFRTACSRQGLPGEGVMFFRRNGQRLKAVQTANSCRLRDGELLTAHSFKVSG